MHYRHRIFHRSLVNNYPQPRLYSNLAIPYKRLCSTGFHKGFYVGRSPMDQKNCYYVCSKTVQKYQNYWISEDGEGVVRYFCCPPDYALDFYSRSCIQTKQISINTFPSTYHSPKVSTLNLNQMQKTNPRLSKFHISCANGKLQSHPYDCQRYYKCLFNSHYVELKCPLNFNWNPYLKICDISYHCLHKSPSAQSNSVTV